jgi:gamma-glutamyltranspeptidase
MEQMMKMIADRNIAQMGFHSKEAVQLMTEVERRAYADRAEFMGDQDFVKVPVKTLSSAVGGDAATAVEAMVDAVEDMKVGMPNF